MNPTYMGFSILWEWIYNTGRRGFMFDGKIVYFRGVP
jgi:hypothetical protein